MVTKRSVRYGRILGLPRLWALPALLVVAIPLLAAGHALADGATVTVTNGNPQFSLDQINPGQSTTANFTVASDAGTATGEGQPAPSITSEAFVANVDSQTAITGVGAWPGAKVTISSKQPTSWAFTVTGSFPAENAPVTVTVQAAANASDGAHPVSLGASYVDTTAGEGAGNQDTENFDVEKLAVDINGPPYVIIGNYAPAGAPPDSDYTVSVTGGVGPSYPVWSVSSNIAVASLHDNQQSLDVYGNGPEGPGALTCNVTNSATHSSGVGYRHPYVQDEFVDTMSPPATLVYGTWNELTPTQTERPAGGEPLSWAVTGSFSATIGVSVTGGFVPELVVAQVGGSVAATATLGISAIATVSAPTPGHEYAEWGRTKRDELTGTETQWGTGGIVKTGQITDWSWANGKYNLEIGGGNTAPPA